MNRSHIASELLQAAKEVTAARVEDVELSSGKWVEVHHNGSLVLREGSSWISLDRGDLRTLKKLI
jgi:hypothetical protein